jgi:nucleoside-triphosphatase THEP1
MRQLILLTGPRGSGKTTRCAELVSQARTTGLNPIGLLSPAVFKDEKKIGIDLFNIATTEQRPLARRWSENSKGIKMGEWCFDPFCFAWGNQILNEFNVSDTIFLDELGPLEFEQNLGLVEGLKLIDEERFHRTFIVIRPELIGLAQRRWPDSKVMDLSSADLALQLLDLDAL